MKKSFKLLVLFASLFVLVSLISFVSAQNAFGDAVINFFNSFGMNTTAIWSKVLLGILLFIIVYSVVREFFHFEGMAKWLVTAIVSVIIVTLSFLYLPDNFTEAITLQYGAMGAAILTAVPFIILFYFSFWVAESLFVTRVIWVFYVLYYFAIFISTFFKKADYTAGFGGFMKYVTTDGLPYLVAIIAGIIIFIFLKGIRKLISKGELEGLEEAGDVAAKRRKILNKLNKKDLEAAGAAGSRV